MEEGGSLGYQEYSDQVQESPFTNNNWGLRPRSPLRGNWKVSLSDPITKLLNWIPKVSDRVATIPNSSNSYLQVNLKYFQNIPAIRGIQQISRPGNRTYMNIKRILQYSSEQN